MIEKDGDLSATIRIRPPFGTMLARILRSLKPHAPHLRDCGDQNDLLFVGDFSGVLHCLDVKTGQAHWTYDMFAQSWASPLIIDDRVYMGDEDGDIVIFKLSAEQEQIGEINMGSAVFTTPIVANGTMFIANRNRLFAIEEGAQGKPVE